MKLNWRKTFAVKEEGDVSNAKINAVVPIFVDNAKLDDHKCGRCVYRIHSSDPASEGIAGATCAIMKGNINLLSGTCMFWGEGKGDSQKVRDRQMTKQDAGYVEAPFPEFKIQCHTCMFYEHDWCHIWQGKVKDEQCCMAYSNEKVKFIK